MEKKEFEDLRKEFEGFLKIVENGIQDMKDFMKCEENNLIYSWKFKFDQKIKDFKLNDFEKAFTDELNEKMKKLMEKSTLNGVEEFKEFIDHKVNDFIKGLENEYEIKSDEEELLNTITNFNRFKKKGLDDFSKKMIENFKKTGFFEKEWIKTNDAVKKKAGTKELNRMIDSFIRNIKNDNSILALTEELTLEFFYFLDRIHSNNELEEANSDLICFEQCCFFISETTTVIIQNKIRKNEEMKTIYKDKSEKKRLEFLELYTNRENDIKLIDNLCINYLNRILELESESFNKRNFERIEEKLKTIPIDPEKFLHFAYEESFTKKNPKAIYHYITDVNDFVAKVFKDHTKEILQDILNEIHGKFEDNVRKNINNFMKNIKNFIKFKKDEVMFLGEELFNNIKEKYPNVNLKYEAFFVRPIKVTTLDNFIKNGNLELKITDIEKQRTSLEIRTKNFIEAKKKIIKGCQATCPQCKSKCIKAAGDHENHKAFHILNCFGGTKYHHTNEAVKGYCLDKKHIENKWIRGEVEYPNYIDLCQKHHPEWVEDFTSNQFIIQEEEEEKKKGKLMVCWFYVHKPILKKYDFKDSNVKTFILDGKALPENYVIFIYFQVYDINFNLGGVVNE